MAWFAGAWVKRVSSYYFRLGICSRNEAPSSTNMHIGPTLVRSLESGKAAEAPMVAPLPS